ncbi:hypothetical protein [Nocardioides sp.]|uniref:hypothetical protein n=1 Tax=Nocardioides sp. TaxID=35761 RepID=UPI00286C10EF|nr:hypothetical protein [Nocardioides sp.]
MVSISYEDSSRRVRIEGACRGEDGAAVAEALRSLPCRGGTLKVDLSATTELDTEVAAAIVAQQREAERRGLRVNVLRRCGSEVDRVLAAAESSLRR